MIYVTGDTHGDFRRFTKHQRARLPFIMTENDYVIVCGDFGLLWNERDKEFEYNIDWLSRLPFTILWVSGNHEGYTLLSEYPVEMWNGGKVQHIVKNKIIHLMRGQVFTIEGKTFFTMGGASSHDIEGGILDMNSPTYNEDKIRAIKSGRSYRVLNKSWWKEELPTEEELEEGLRNLEKCDYKVDYVISHCASNHVQEALEHHRLGISYNIGWYKQDILTNFFEELEGKLQYKQWFCGHYHEDFCIDDKHTILFYKIIPIDERGWRCLQ